MARHGAKLTIAVAALAAFLTVAHTSAAPLTYSRFGDAAAVSGGEQLRSDGDPGWGGLDFNLPVAIDFADITTLSSTYAPESDDACAAGSPRFQLNVDTTGDGDADANVFVYVGDAPSGVSCPGGTTGDTGNLIGAGGEDPGRYDTSQLVSGTQVNTYSGTAAIFAANPSWQIVGIQEVVDSGWAFGDGEQTIVVNPTVEVKLPQATNKDDCKRTGWRDVFRADGSSFKNQGDCIQYLNTGK